MEERDNNRARGGHVVIDLTDTTGQGHSMLYKPNDNPNSQETRYLTVQEEKLPLALQNMAPMVKEANEYDKLAESLVPQDNDMSNEKVNYWGRS